MAFYVLLIALYCYPMLTCKRGAFFNIFYFSGLIPILLPALSKINMTYKSHALLFKQYLWNEATAMFLFTSENEEMHSPEMYFKNEPLLNTHTIIYVCIHTHTHKHITSKTFLWRWVFSELFYTNYFVSSSSHYLHSILFPYIRKFQEILLYLTAVLYFSHSGSFKTVFIFTSGPTEDFCISLLLKVSNHSVFLCICELNRHD